MCFLLLLFNRKHGCAVAARRSAATLGQGMGGARVGYCVGANILLNWFPPAVRSADLEKSAQRINSKAPHCASDD
eukprot:6194104-Alexandrium_andersonii.AAC.1